jgi:3-deoxy-D-manno-octulosonate 8-phosphate phosphatase (KDO 8-P phosphatase)
LKGWAPPPATDPTDFQMTISADIANRAKGVRLILLDVDGVLTDGTVYIGSSGEELKGFSIRDGWAIQIARRHGVEIGLLSGRPSKATTRRADELGLVIVVQTGPDKRQAYADLISRHGFDDVAVAYMGDDVLDLPVLGRVGLSTAPADASLDVRTRVHWVAEAGGGRGAVRQLIELVLRAQGRWDDVITGYLA